jgi:oxygen-independent coproporphyrinogen III oxidase
MPTLPSILTQSPYQDYVYAYPHKTAYRALEPRSLNQVWATEDCTSCFLYIHIPFCEMRCGFCNLFTTVMHDDDFVNQYIQAVQRQADRLRDALGAVQFTRFALGGGTPTQLPMAGLTTILDIAEKTLGVSLQTIPMSVEVSPETASLDKLQLLRDRGTDRISMGVQSFIDTEVLASQRRQTTPQVQATIDRIRQVGFRTLNLDLIYGLPGQTVTSWLQSIDIALAFQPEELYLYPLYVRPLTGLGISDREWDDIRLACYRAGRDRLRVAGYQQQSMRMFQASHATAATGPVYCCQADDMVGLGCGARSYTRSLHYSYDYAVDAKEIKTILARYIANDHRAFETVNYGIELNLEEQKRRFLLLSLLSEAGVDSRLYTDRFHAHIIDDFVILKDLQIQGLITIDDQSIRLTESGIERSDAIGPMLFSASVKTLMQQYQIK